MRDVQNQRDHRNIAIDKVGVKEIRYPITVLDKATRTQQTVATINMYVNLPKDFKGTHMSRLVEILTEHDRTISIKNFSDILSTMKKRLNAESAHIEITFPYFVMKTSPVTKSQGLMEYRCTFKGSLNNGKDHVVLIHVPVTTLCPCSREISDFGAHNQRGEVRLQVRSKKFMWIEDLINLVEENASCDVYSVLKREDEKYVTEKAYRNPKFVEDVVRDIAEKLQNDTNIVWFAVECENFESIHNHNAYAYIERDKNKR
jgi:GTP cyclohydrolase I